jgi:hypothetical protein
MASAIIMAKLLTFVTLWGLHSKYYGFRVRVMLYMTKHGVVAVEHKSSTSAMTRFQWQQ